MWVVRGSCMSMALEKPGGLAGMEVSRGGSGLVRAGCRHAGPLPPTEELFEVWRRSMGSPSNQSQVCVSHAKPGKSAPFSRGWWQVVVCHTQVLRPAAPESPGPQAGQSSVTGEFRPLEVGNKLPT